MSGKWDETVKYPAVEAEQEVTPVKKALTEVTIALEEKGVQPPREPARGLPPFGRSDIYYESQKRAQHHSQGGA